MRKYLVVPLILCFIGLCLGLSLMNCGISNNEDDENENDQITFSGTIENWDSLSDTKLRAFFWYGSYVTDPLNYILSETTIQPDGSFEITLPEIPEENTTPISGEITEDSPITVSNYNARRSNYIELAIFDSSDDYLYMLYRTDIPQGQIPSLPFFFVHRVYFTEDLILDGVNIMTEPGYYSPSGEWIEQTRKSYFRYDNVHFKKGWNRYILRTISAEPTKIENEILVDEPEGAKWYYYDRPDLDVPPAE